MRHPVTFNFLSLEEHFAFVPLASGQTFVNTVSAFERINMLVCLHDARCAAHSRLQITTSRLGGRVFFQRDYKNTEEI